METFLFASIYPLQLSRSLGKQSISYRLSTFSGIRGHFSDSIQFVPTCYITNQLSKRGNKSNRARCVNENVTLDEEPSSVGANFKVAMLQR